MASILEYILSGELPVDTLVSFLKRNPTNEIVTQKARTKVIGIWEWGWAIFSIEKLTGIAYIQDVL